MRRCLNCMEEYPDQHKNTCPYCGFTEGERESEAFCIRPGSILQKRYIAGNLIKARDSDLVYIGWDALFERKVQIQEYFPRNLASRKDGITAEPVPSGEEKYQKGLESFYSRSRELLRLYQEEDIITYYACFQENGTAYGIMDYQKRESLSHRLQGRAIKPETAMEFLQKAITAVDKVHKIGGFHGMIGIDTFWITSQDKLILKDFGGWLTDTGTKSRENMEGGEDAFRQDPEEAGIREDIYGLAKLFCRLVTGREILNAGMLEEAVRANKNFFKKPAAAALKRALNRETRTLRQLWTELNGEEAKKPGIPVPLMIGAAAAVVLVIIIAVLLLGGIL